MATQRAEPTVTLPPWSIDEPSVLRHARAGDLDAFRQLVLHHQARVFGTALHSTGRRHQAVELAQEVFVALHGALPRISNPAHLLHWLSRAVSQRTTEWLGQEARAGNVVVVEEPAGSPHAHAHESAHDAVPDPGADFTAGVMVRLEHRWSHRRQARATANRYGRRARRRMVWGMLVVAGVAVALLVLHLSGVLWPVATEIAAPIPAVATAGAPEARLPADSLPVPPGGEAPGIASTVSLSPAMQDAYPRYTVIVMPLRQESPEAAASASVAAFHAALLDELRKVPGLTLLIPGVTAAPVGTSRPADYLLTVTSLQTTALASGGVAFRVAGGTAGGSVATTSSQQWPVQIRIQPIEQLQSGGFSSVLQVGEEADAARLAAQQVEMLRAQFFPDALVRQQLMTRLRDDSPSGTERERALSALIDTQLGGRGPGLDAVSIAAILQQTAVLRADQRAQLWRELRGSAYPELVEPLLDSLRRDPEEDVRFEALATLAADHGKEPRVRAAIESAAREDPQLVVRMAARRALDGEAGWRTYIVATLRDGSLPYAERLAPLLLAARSAVTPAETQQVKALVNDAEMQQLLAGVVRDGWFDVAQAEAIGDALGLLADGGNPVTPGVLVQVMPEVPGATPPQSTPPPAPSGPQVSPATMAWLLSHRNNPRVRRMLDDIARGNPDPRLEIIVEQMRRAEQIQRVPQRRQGF